MEKYQAIVVGAGMSGSWVAKELCDKGIKTLLIERGKNVVHLQDYPTANNHPWDFKYRGKVDLETSKSNPIASKCYLYSDATKHFISPDEEHPYVQEKKFDWIKGYQVGGKSLLWARQTQRWSKYDFDGPARDEYGIEWPISYDDLAPWYSHVEKFVGISGERDGLESLPDGEFLPPMELSCVDHYIKDVIKENYDDRHYIYARCAHITEPQEIHLKQGRGKCQNRTLCERGCPYGGYFSANSSTIPWALRTGNLTLMTDQVVHSVLYDESNKKAKGVKLIDAKTKEETEITADVVFLNAGAINSNMILLNSKSPTFKNGLGNHNGLMGKYFAFHNYRARVSATCTKFSDKTTEGKTPTNGYIPRFRNLKRKDSDFVGGYAIAMYCNRRHKLDINKVGDELLEEILREKQFSDWEVFALMMAETVPKETNQISLHPTKKDQYGMPLINFHVDYDENDEKIIADFHREMKELFIKAGFVDIKLIDTKQAPGLDIHEMGGIRMGKDPSTSLLNEWNQLHTCKNVFVTDGACMTSTSTQNPSLTYMAISARAANYAADKIKNGQSFE